MKRLKNRWFFGVVCEQIVFSPQTVSGTAGRQIHGYGSLSLKINREEALKA